MKTNKFFSWKLNWTVGKTYFWSSMWSLDVAVFSSLLFYITNNYFMFIAIILNAFVSGMMFNNMYCSRMINKLCDFNDRLFKIIDSKK